MRKRAELKPKVIVTSRIDPATATVLSAWAQQRDLTVSKAIERAVLAQIANEANSEEA